MVPDYTLVVPNMDPPRNSPHSQSPGQPVHRQTSLTGAHLVYPAGWFLRGETAYKPIQIVDFWLHDPARHIEQKSPAYANILADKA